MNDLGSARWFKSTKSQGGEACVEAAHLSGGHVGVRDSKDPTGPALVFSPSGWDTFLSAVRTGEFDLA